MWERELKWRHACWIKLQRDILYMLLLFQRPLETVGDICWDGFLSSNENKKIIRIGAFVVRLLWNWKGIRCCQRRVLFGDETLLTCQPNVVTYPDALNTLNNWLSLYGWYAMENINSLSQCLVWERPSQKRIAEVFSIVSLAWYQRVKISRNIIQYIKGFRVQSVPMQTLVSCREDYVSLLHDRIRNTHVRCGV